MQTLAALLLLSVPAAPAAAGDTLGYVAERGVETRYSFTESTDLRVTRLRSDAGGQVLERTDFRPRYRQRTARRWRDRVERADCGRDLEFVRTIERAAEELTLEIAAPGGAAGEGTLGRAVASSDLEGERVRFVWSDAESAHRARRAEPAPGEDATPGWLGALSADTTGRAFLPPDDLDAAPGSTWSVDAADLAGLLAPGGTMPGIYGPLEGIEDPDVLALYGSLSASRLAGDVTGTARATWRSTTERVARRVALVDVDFDVALVGRPAPWMQEQSRPYALALVGQGAREARVDARMKGTARLTWDLEEGRLVEARLRAESDFRVRVAYAFATGDQDVAGAVEFDLEGDTQITFTAER